MLRSLHEQACPALHYPDGVTATMGRLCSTHARPTAAQKTFYIELQQGMHSHGGQRNASQIL